MAYSFLKNYNDPVVLSSKTYIEVIRKRVETEPGTEIFKFLENGIDETESLNYRQLDTRSKAVGAAMQSVGKKGDRVLLLFPAGLRYVASLFACFYSGMIAVPAYPPRRNRNLNRVLSIIEDSGAKIAVVTRQVYKDIERNFADNKLLRDIKWILYDDIDDKEANRWQETEILPDDIALIQYTSGSTGNPKGVMLTQLNLFYNSEYIHQTFEFTRETTIGMNWLPIFHDMGLIGGILQAAYLGGLNIGMPPVEFLKSPFKWLKAITKYKATVGGGPNFGFDYCIEKISDEEKKDLDLSSMNTFYCGAEPVRKYTMEKFPEAFSSCGAKPEQLYPVYGMAETTLIATGGFQKDPPKFLKVKQDKLWENIVEPTTGNDEKTVELVGCGHTWLETELVIVNHKTFEKAGAMEVGEIWIKGPTVAKGYWNKPEETKRTFGAYLKDTGEGPFLRTGDLGFVYENELYITGRLKDLIIIRGVNHYPSDIEYTVERSHSALRSNAGAAFSVLKNGTEKLVVVQELERTAMRNADYNEIFDKIRAAVADEHELEVYSIVLIRTGSIPLTSSGKIQRRQTRYDFLSDNLNVVAQWQKQEGEDKDNIGEKTAETVVPTEEKIKEWLVNWIVRNQHFGKDEIDLDKEITSYGIDSLSAVTLEQEISEYFGFEWHVSSFMLNPTINGLAKEGVQLYKKEKEAN